jgi:hypothetical protein
MAVVVATRFTVRRARDLPRFLSGSMAAGRQARRSAGFVSGRLRVEPRSGVFWTLTAWESGRDMVAFRDSGVHAVLVPKLAAWAGEAVFGVWNSADRALPGWGEVSRRVAEHPNFAPLDYPAPAQRGRRFDPARRFGLELPMRRPRRAR